MKGRRIVLVLLAMVVACSGDETGLSDVRSDPMAQYTHPELTLVSKIELGADLFGGDGGPRPRVESVYLADEEADIESILEDIAASAEVAGWAMNPEEPAKGDDPWSQTGSKEFQARLAFIEIVVDIDLENPRQILIRLEYAPDFGQ